MPKTNYYRSDGSGRDTYIAYDNGGVFRPMNKLISQGKIMIRSTSSASKCSMRSLHYVPDGTGRDSYVKIGDGGLHASSSPHHFLTGFKASLRTYQPCKVINDPYIWTQSNWKDNKTRSISRVNNKKMQNCIDRLYKTR